MATRVKATKAPSANGTTTANGPAATGTTVAIPAMDIRTAKLEIVGVSPLIVHRWSEKAKKQMLNKAQGAARQKKDPKDPEQEFLDSLYVVPGFEEKPTGSAGKYYFPALAFKNAAVDGTSFFDKDVTKVMVRGALFITNEPHAERKEPMALLRFSELAMREDVGRIGMGTADLRYRGQFNDWETDLFLDYDARMFSIEQLVNLFNRGGFSVGVGEWRPQKDGDFGRFRVAQVTA